MTPKPEQSKPTVTKRKTRGRPHSPETETEKGTGAKNTDMPNQPFGPPA